MARGRHAASAAKRRAESAEEQLDRLLPKLVEAQRIAHRYRTEAEQVPVLRRQLNDLRDHAGVPADEHRAALMAADRDLDVALATYDAAIRVVLTAAATVVAQVRESPKRDIHEVRFITPSFVEAVSSLPEGSCDALLKAVGARRDWRRSAENWGAFGETIRVETEREYLHLAMSALGAELSVPERRALIKECEDLTGRTVFKSDVVVKSRHRRRLLRADTEAAS